MKTGEPEHVQHDEPHPQVRFRYPEVHSGFPSISDCDQELVIGQMLDLWAVVLTEGRRDFAIRLFLRAGRE